MWCVSETNIVKPTPGKCILKDTLSRGKNARAFEVKKNGQLNTSWQNTNVLLFQLILCLLEHTFISQTFVGGKICVGIPGCYVHVCNLLKKNGCSGWLECRHFPSCSKKNKQNESPRDQLLHLSHHLLIPNGLLSWLLLFYCPAAAGQFFPPTNWPEFPLSNRQNCAM